MFKVLSPSACDMPGSAHAVLPSRELPMLAGVIAGSRSRLPHSTARPTPRTRETGHLSVTFALADLDNRQPITVGCVPTKSEGLHGSISICDRAARPGLKIGRAHVYTTVTNAHLV